MDELRGTAGHTLELCSTVAKTVGLKQSAVYDQLWPKGRLQISDCSEFAIPHDHILARLVQKAVETRRSLFVRVPNYDGFTVPLAFATAVAAEAVENLGKTGKSGSPSKVLLVGTTTDIRKYLRQTRIGSFRLDAIFAQSDMTRSQSYSGDAVEQALASSLPKVITSYDPVSIVGLLRTISPHWVAADIRKYVVPEWLPPLVEDTTRTHTPLLLFYRTPFRELRELAQKANALMIELPLVGAKPAKASDLAGWTVDWTTKLSPLLPSGDIALKIDGHLFKAQCKLAKVTQSTVSGHLERSTLMLAWRAYRFLTTLCCPMGMAESASSTIWGATSWSHLESSLVALLRTLEATNLSVHHELDAALIDMKLVQETMGDVDVPLWNALVNIVMEKRDGYDKRTLVFHSRAKRSLFEFALLARCNISVDDLESIGIRLADFDQLNRSYRTIRRPNGLESLDLEESGQDSDQGSLTLVGLPSWSYATRLDPWIRGQDVEVCCYPHQLRELNNQIGWLASSLGIDNDRLTDVFKAVGARWDVDLLPVPRQIHCATPESIDAARAEQLAVSDSEQAVSGPLAPKLSQMDEIAALLQLDDEGLDDSSSTFHDESHEEVVSESLVVDKAVEIDFIENFIGLFAPSDLVNIVVKKGNGFSTESRYVRSVRAGDVLFFIHGSRRQNLYDMLLSRLHEDPALEMTLELIKRWQEGLAQAFKSRHLSSGYSVENLLADIQAHGSALTVPLTVHFWLTGHTLGPNDRDDLLRVGKALNIPLLINHHVKVDHALRRIRGLHRSLAARLDNWIELQINGGIDDSDDDAFDEELGIHLRDFRDSVQLLHVKETRIKTGTFLWRSLGQIVRKG